MKNYIPVEKQSKKAQREFHNAQRGSWYGMSPVTRKSKNGKQYDRAAFKKGGAF